MKARTRAILDNARLLEYIKGAKCVMYRMDAQDEIERISKDEAVFIITHAEYKFDYIVHDFTVKFGEIDFERDSSLYAHTACSF